MRVEHEDSSDFQQKDKSFYSVMLLIDDKQYVCNASNSDTPQYVQNSNYIYMDYEILKNQFKNNRKEIYSSQKTSCNLTKS